MNGNSDNKATLETYIKRATATILSALDDLPLSVEEKNKLRRVVMDTHELLYYRMRSGPTNADG